MIAWYARAYGFTATALRYFNAAGADPDGELGERHQPETHLIPLAIDAARGRVPAPGDLWCRLPDSRRDGGAGLRARRGPGRCPMRALERPGPHGAMRIYNLGAGQGSSVREVVAMVERVGGRNVPLVQGGRRPGDPPVLLADVGKAARELGWRPERSSLDLIVRSAWNWHTARPEMSR